jgi:hypothetical protein
MGGAHAPGERSAEAQINSADLSDARATSGVGNEDTRRTIQREWSRNRFVAAPRKGR